MKEQRGFGGSAPQRAAPTSTVAGAAAGLANDTGEYNCFLNAIIQVWGSLDALTGISIPFHSCALQGGEFRCLCSDSVVTCISRHAVAVSTLLTVCITSAADPVILYSALMLFTA